MNKKTILLAMPSHNDIYKVMEKALAFHGFHVIPAISDEKFQYPSLSSRLKIKFKQTIFKDLTAKQVLKDQIFREKIYTIVNENKSIDYALFIRADLYPNDLLELIKGKVRGLMVNYQWDGMQRYPDIWQKIPYFDRFYVFTPEDIQHEKMSFLPTTNFYFDHDLDDIPPTTSDIYFTGTHIAERAHSIAQFGQYAQETHLKLDFNLAWFEKNIQDARKFYPTENINIFQKIRSFEENLQSAKQAKVLVDFKTPVHNGLSFRAFEALGYRKKLITTNENIKKYDFYHPNNIFILENNNFHEINNFLLEPYYPIDPIIYQKYSLNNWIKYVLDILPNTPILLP